MPKTYAQIRKEQDLFEKLFPERKGMSSADYAELMTQVMPGEYQAGMGRGLGKVLKGASYGIDELIGDTGRAGAGRIGEWVAGDLGRQAFEGLPRALVNMAPMALGPAGVPITAGLMGGDIYEKTDSPLAGAVGGAATFLFPGAGRLGGRAATSLAGKAGMNTARTQAMALTPKVGLMSGAAATQAVAQRGATSLIGGGVLKSRATRGVEFLGQQTGYLGLGTAIQSVTGGIAAPWGEKLSAMGEAFRPENLAVSALSNLPFLAVDVPRLSVMSKEAKFSRDHASTVERYDTERWQPVRERNALTQLRAAVDAKMEAARKVPLRLPAPGLRSELQTEPRPVKTESAAPALADEIAATKAKIRTAKRKGQVDKFDFFKEKLAKLEALRTKPIELSFSDGLLARVATEIPQPILDKVAAFQQEAIDLHQQRVAQAEQEIASAKARGQDTTVAEKLLLQKYADLKTATSRSQVLTSTDPQISVAAAHLVTGRPPSMTQDSVVQKTAKGVPLEDAVIEETTRLVNKAKRKLTKEERSVKDKEEEAVRDQEKMDFVRQWMADPLMTEELKTAFKKGLSKLGPNSDVKADVSMASALRNWDQKGGPKGLLNYLSATANDLNSNKINRKTRKVIDTFEDEATASVQAEAMKSDDNTYYYQREGNKVVRYDWLETAVQGGGKVVVAPEAQEATSVMTEVDDLIETQAQRDEETHLVELWKEELGVDLTPEAQNIVLEGKVDLDLVKEQLRAALRSGKVVAGTSDKVKKFLGLAPGTAGISAGGGFWYNLGKFDPATRTLGKYMQLPKDGLVPEEQFARIGRGTDQPLAKGEVELMRLLVPEAFVDGKVNLETLYELLPEREPTVEVKVLDNSVVMSGDNLQRQINDIRHSLDTVDSNWMQWTAAEQESQPADIRSMLDEEARLTSLEGDLGEQGRGGRENVTKVQWMNIAPRAELDMPGYVEGLVRVGNVTKSEIELRQQYNSGVSAQQNERNAGILYRGPHYGSEDTNVIGVFRGYMETLPGDEKAFHVIEVQSDWGQARREVIKFNEHPNRAGNKMEPAPDHPLLGAYENLSLKAAIKHARDNGATKLILSDAETAMMSERHDTGVLQDRGDGELSNRPKQEGGMRLHYDTTLPSEMRRISGDKGERVELGVHEKAKRDLVRAQQEEFGDDPAFTRQMAQMTSQRSDPHIAGSPVFRDSLGKPKTQITGTLYDISKVPISEAGSGKAFGESTQPEYIGERVVLGRLLEDVGLADHVDEVGALVSLFDQSEVAYAKLLGGPDAPLGLFTQQREGQKLIWLRASGDPALRKVFALTHEYNGHYLLEMADAGKLDAETTQRLNVGRQFIADNTPEANTLMLREMLEMLPSKYAKDKDLVEGILSTAHDPDEVMANINAIASLALVSKQTPAQWRSFFNWMPKPLVDLMAVFVRMGRKVYESISGLLFSRDMRWTQGPIDPEARRQLHSYIDALYEIMRFDNERVEATRQALKLEMASSTPRDFAQALVGGTFNDPVTSAGNEIVKQFGLPEKVSKEMRRLSKKLDYTVFRQAALAIKHPQFRRTFTQDARRQSLKNQLVDQVLPHIGLYKHGTEIKAREGSPVFVVAKDLHLNDLKNALQHRASETKKTVQQNIDEGDAETLATLSKIGSTDKQQQVREAIVRQEAFQNGMTDISHWTLYEKLKMDYMGVLMLQDKTLLPDAAQQLADQQVEMVKAGQLQPATPNDAWLLGMTEKLESKINEFRNHPEFITYRRFGSHAVRVFKRDGSYSVVDHHSEGALEKWRRENAAGLTSGELREQPLRKDKQPYNVAESGLEFLQSRIVDKREDVIAGLEQLGIDHDVAVKFAQHEFDLAADVRKELAARQLPSSTPHRKLVEGYKELDTLFQQVEFMQVMIDGQTRGVANSEMASRLLDPRLDATPEVRDTIDQAWKNTKQADSKSVRTINRVNYLMYMTLHPLNMLQDFVQPLTGALPAALINDGGGIRSSFGAIMKAIADVGKTRLKGHLAPDEMAVLDRFKKGNRSMASFSDMESNEYLRVTNLNRVAKGEEVLTIGQMLKSWVHMGVLWQKNLHKLFTDFGMDSAMLTSYRHFRKKGLNEKDAEASAFDMASVAMDSLGRGGRAAGIWSADQMRPVSAILTALQTYAFHQIGTWKGTFERAIGEVKGMTKDDRTAAWKALGTHTASMFAQAGILGLPLAGALMVLIDKTFDINSKEEVAKVLHDNLDAGEDHTVQQAALHGLVNSLGGVDYASRAQTPGVLGLNARDGFSPESLLGPSYSIIENLFGGVSDVAQGKVGKGLSRAFLPNNLRRATQAWRDEWEFRRTDGTLIDESTTFEQSVYAVLGLKPARIASLQERDTWQRQDAEIQQNERAEWLDDIAELLIAGDNAGAKTAILQRVADRPGETPAGVADAVAERVINKTSPKDVSRQPGASEGLNRVTGLPSYSIGDVERLQLADSIKRGLGLGLPLGRGQMQRAQLIDQVRNQSPWLSHREASQQVDQMTGRSQMQELLGGQYGQRMTR